MFGSEGIRPFETGGGYGPLVAEIADFFLDNEAPVPPSITIEMFAFMEAADQSKREGGRPVKIADVMATARQSVAARP